MGFRAKTIKKVIDDKINDWLLHNPKVLEDQLTGVDAAYFIQLMQKLKEKDPEKINSAYLIEIIDRMF